MRATLYGSRARDRFAASLGVDPRSAYTAGLEGALCDEATRERLRTIGDAFDWAQIQEAELV